MKYVFLVLEILCILVAVVLQVRSFLRTRKAMARFGKHAGEAFSGLRMVDVAYERDSLVESEVMDRVIHCGKPEGLDEEDIEEMSDVMESIELIDSPVLHNDEENDFRNVIVSTNSYLVKNKGIASDFSIRRDICERRIQAEDESVSESLSTPLYLGLCGTFVGIIFGILGMIAGGGVISGSDNILIGVAIAMTASLLGLGLTTWSRVMLYPEMSGRVEKSKNDYYDFMQRDLMPSLSLGVAGTLASFKDVLGSFISKFGNNINGYAETARLMNENLASEHLVLQEINNLNITKASKTIADSFATLKDSSEELKTFKEYQTTLNQTIARADDVATRMEGIIGTFSGFVSSLDKVAAQADETKELQRQFKESLELHFPTIKDHETLWREQIDEISKDTQESSRSLQEYMRTASEYVRNFVADNNTFLSGLVDMKEAAAQLRTTTAAQTSQFASYEDSMKALKESIDRLYSIEADNQRSVMTAVKTLLEDNTNPQYTAKLEEINQALGKLAEGRKDVLAEAKGTLAEIKGVVAEKEKDNEALRKSLAVAESEVEKMEGKPENAKKDR